MHCSGGGDGAFVFCPYDLVDDARIGVAVFGGSDRGFLFVGGCSFFLRDWLVDVLEVFRRGRFVEIAFLFSDARGCSKFFERHLPVFSAIGDGSISFAWIRSL